MVLDQNKKYTIGIAMTENTLKKITVPWVEQQGTSLFCRDSTNVSSLFLLPGRALEN
jgi:hypothetical protein